MKDWEVAILPPEDVLISCFFPIAATLHDITRQLMELTPRPAAIFTINDRVAIESRGHSFPPQQVVLEPHLIVRESCGARCSS
jgi:DNA-binding LacI/PurR family transcriptional regulator